MTRKNKYRGNGSFDKNKDKKTGSKRKEKIEKIQNRGSRRSKGKK